MLAITVCNYKFNQLSVSGLINRAFKAVSFNWTDFKFFYAIINYFLICCRCYLNGDGIGQGTHFSLFFVVMNGLYDALLSWPFHQRVTMTLLNQFGGWHASDTFRPYVRSSTTSSQCRYTLQKLALRVALYIFCTCCREIDKATGYPCFIRIEDFLHGGYIKEDCVFVKVVVDCSDLHGNAVI